MTLDFPVLFGPIRILIALSVIEPESSYALKFLILILVTRTGLLPSYCFSVNNLTGNKVLFAHRAEITR